jgi:hypothetical protein
MSGATSTFSINRVLMLAQAEMHDMAEVVVFISLYPIPQVQGAIQMVESKLRRVCHLDSKQSECPSEAF